MAEQVWAATSQALTTNYWTSSESTFAYILSASVLRPRLSTTSTSALPKKAEALAAAVADFQSQRAVTLAKDAVCSFDPLLNFWRNMTSLAQPAPSALHPLHALGQSDKTRTVAAAQASASPCMVCSLAHLMRDLQVALLPPWEHGFLHSSSGESVVVLVRVLLVLVRVEATVELDDVDVSVSVLVWVAVEEVMVCVFEDVAVPVLDVSVELVEVRLVTVEVFVVEV